jgi:hypothetical protein
MVKTITSGQDYLCWLSCLHCLQRKTKFENLIQKCKKYEFEKNKLALEINDVAEPVAPAYYYPSNPAVWPLVLILHSLKCDLDEAEAAKIDQEISQAEEAEESKINI